MISGRQVCRDLGIALLAICLALSVTERGRSAEPLLPYIFDDSAYPTLKLRGRIDADMLGSDQSEKNQATFGELPDTAGLRRARIGIEGN